MTRQDMRGALQDAMDAPHIAAHIESLPAQLLNRLRNTQ